MLLKITIIGKRCGYYTVEDYTEYYNDIFVDEGKDAANRYFKQGTFTEEQVDELNGEHFLFGYLETLCQSDDFPYWLFNHGDLKYKVEKVG